MDIVNYSKILLILVKFKNSKDPEEESGCRRYYLCSFSGTPDANISFFTCPSRLIFDKVTKSCNFPYAAVCDKKSKLIKKK